MDKTILISCPQCGHKFNVEEVLAHRIEERYREEHNRKIARMQAEFAEKEKAILEKEDRLGRQAMEIEKTVHERLKEGRSRLAEELRLQLKGEFDEQLTALNEENEQRRKQIQELSKARIENEQLKRRLDEQGQELQLQFERAMTEKLREESENIRKREAERIELRIREKDEVIGTLRHQIDEMKRKAEQGSMQLQGEVQELALQELLASTFGSDLIEEVGKGIKGADVIQTVRDRFGRECGRIIYESKRTKAFNNDWIQKLKHDAVGARADLCVIVTETMPEGMERIGVRDGVWICPFQDLKGLVLVLRDSLVRVAASHVAQANKGEKMQMLYDYLTSNEFRLQLGAIVEGFSNIQDSYIKEKRAMERIWKEREKQLERILLNTNHFIGSIQGIAGSSIPEIRQIGESDLVLEE
ncbi:MAG: DUF2130 domain-containing protein [Chloroflexota bacterium]